jgi:ketosteroid isomerase-like protein
MVIVSVVLLCVACATTAPSGESSVQQMAETFEAGARAANVDQLTSIYAEDAVLMPPGLPAMNGIAAIRQFFGGFLAGGPSDIDITIEDIQQSGDMIVERGRFTMTKPVSDTGKYVIVWRKRGDRWYAVTDIFNSSMTFTESK